MNSVELQEIAGLTTVSSMSNIDNLQPKTEIPPKEHTGSISDQILDEFFVRLAKEELVNKETLAALIGLRLEAGLSKPTKIESAILVEDPKQ